jgi:hypothetical protein
VRLYTMAWEFLNVTFYVTDHGIKR